MDLYRILLFALCTSLVLGRKRQRCHSHRNEYYSEATKACKKCDPCPKGEGLQEDNYLDVDTEKGALECRICRRCVNDTYQRRHKAFKKCRKCRQCKTGEIEIQGCTNMQNRRCKKRTETTISISSSNQRTLAPSTTEIVYAKHPVAVPMMAEPVREEFIDESKINLKINSDNNNDFDGYKIAFGTTAGFMCVVVVVLAYVFMRRRKQQQRSDVHERDSQTSLENLDSTEGGSPVTEITQLEQTIVEQRNNSDDEKYQTLNMKDHTEQTDCKILYEQENNETDALLTNNTDIKDGPCYIKQPSHKDADSGDTLSSLSTFECPTLSNQPCISSLKLMHNNRSYKIFANEKNNSRIASPLQQKRQNFDSAYDGDSVSMDNYKSSCTSERTGSEHEAVSEHFAGHIYEQGNIPTIITEETSSVSESSDSDDNQGHRGVIMADVHGDQKDKSSDSTVLYTEKDNQTLHQDRRPSSDSAESQTDEFPQRLMQILADNMAPNHQVPIGRLLHIPENTIETIQADFPSKTEQAYQILKKWKQINGTSATKAVLRKALKEAENPRAIAKSHGGLTAEDWRVLSWNTTTMDNVDTCRIQTQQ